MGFSLSPEICVIEKYHRVAQRATEIVTDDPGETTCVAHVCALAGSQRDGIV